MPESNSVGEPFQEPFQLLPVDAATPEEVLGTEGKEYKLPLTQQDRERIERVIEKKRQLRFTLKELLCYTALACLMLGTFRWIQFELYTVLLGLLALYVFVRPGETTLSKEHRNRMFAILLFGYLACVTSLLLKC